MLLGFEAISRSAGAGFFPRVGGWVVVLWIARSSGCWHCCGVGVLVGWVVV